MVEQVLNLYLSPTGNDNWSGIIDKPLATPAGARDAIRHHKSESGNTNLKITVHIADGVYELADTLLFNSEDSGTVECPIRYVAAPGASPVISGGRRITGWHETTHNDLRCWVVDLPDVATGNWNFTRLYANSVSRQRPRLPENGFYHFTGIDGCRDIGFHNWCQGPDRANFAPGNIKEWHNWEDVELITYQLWFDTHHRFKSIDEQAGIAYFHANSLGSLKDERDEFARYFVENVFEAFNTPGQWYLDRIAGKLYYLPLSDETMETTVITAPRLEEILRIQGEGCQRASNIHFENITFAHQQWVLPLDCPGYIQAAFGVPGAIILEGAENCIFYGCTITHVNGYGIEILAGSTNNVIAACVINDTGGGGIKIGHEQLVPHDSTVGNNFNGDFPAGATTVVDCTIRDCGHVFPSAIGIWIGNSGWNRIQHNRIFNCNYTGISCGWTWGYTPTRTICNLIEYNHIHHINNNEILSDNGGIYTLGQQPGTVLRGNVIHDISCYGYGAWGIYPDEGSSEMLVENNLVCGTKKASYSAHYGIDNFVRNNIFALSQHEHLSLGKRELHRSTTFRNNVVVAANGEVNGVSWETSQYTAQYTIEDNIFWSIDGTPFTFNGKSLESMQYNNHIIGALVADPLFLDAQGGDFSLRLDSPVKNIGFKPFDWRKSGPRLIAERPLKYSEYKEIFPMPALEVPVIRIKIKLLTSLGDIESTGKAEFSVVIINAGRANGKGSIRLKSGPDGIAESPVINRIKFDLLPGEEYVENITINVAKNADIFWLDSEPEDNNTIPARAIVFDPEKCGWVMSHVSNVIEPRDICAALINSYAYSIMDINRLVADVKIGANSKSLLFFANFYESELRPNTVEPWMGTGFELLTIATPDHDSPVDQPPQKHQLFIIPTADGTGVDILLLNAADNCVERIPDIAATSTPITGGCELAVIIPWHFLGYSEMPKSIPFELIVDCVSKTTGNILQIPSLDLPGDGYKRLYGKLKIE